MRRKSNIKAGTLLVLLIAAVSIILIAAPAKANLVALWKFEEKAPVDTNLVLDSSSAGFHIDGRLVKGPNDVNSPLISTKPKRITNVHGLMFGQALEFGVPVTGTPTAGTLNRNWNYVAIDANEKLKDLGTKWTIAFWYKQYTNDPLVHYAPGGGSGYQRMLSCPEYEVEAGVPTDLQDYFWPYETAVWEIAIGSSASLNNWHHFALTYDGTTLTRYTDGTATFSTTSIVDQQLPKNMWGAEALTIGAQTYPLKDFFIGAIDDIGIFNECLDSTQVNAIKGNNWSGPWIVYTYETTTPGSFVWDYSFIGQKDTIQLALGQKRNGELPGVPSWNWWAEGDISNLSYFGLVNAGAIDGDSSNYEYAAYTTVGTQVVYPDPDNYKERSRIHKNTKYDFKLRFAGENAIGNVVGVRFYAADVNNPANKTLITDLHQTITANATWIPMTYSFTADAVNFPDNTKTFKVECYVEQGSGNPRGTAFGWFDYVRIDVNDYLDCEAYYYGHNNSDPCLPYDISKDCKMNMKDFGLIADVWTTTNDPEPSTTDTELLKNNDFYADIALVPNAGDNDEITPTGWTFIPSTFDANEAGLWNVSAMGTVGAPVVLQPAGGSVAAYIDPNVDLQQVVTSPTIVSGQTYYLSAMLSGVAYSYQHNLKVVYEYIDNPVSPASVVQIAIQDYNTLPDNTAWRRFCNVWTAPPAAAGKYFRVRAEYGSPSIPGFTPANMGWGLIGDISIDTVKPEYWQRSNLLTNGDFEDYSNLPMGDLSSTYGWLRLVGTYNGWNWDFHINPPPGWHFYEDDLNWTEGGLQCMLWAPAPQPAHGRSISAVLGHPYEIDTEIVEIEQKVTSETIQAGQTYYLDFIGCVSAQNYNTGAWPWPEPDPNIIVDLYWLAAGQNDLTGTQDIDYGLITSLKKPADNGMGANGGHWQVASTSFTADAHAGKTFYVKAYGEAVYTTFDEIYLSKEPLQILPNYTCGDLIANGGRMAADFNNDCYITFEDLDLLVSDWLQCNDPAGCN
ncbi:MAG: LamG-like jellyroll fold domain-containing protein [Phycisphaerales bacterium]